MDQQSNAINQNKSIVNQPNSESHINFTQLAKMQLKDYEDIDEDEFLVDDDKNKLQANFQNYLHVPQNHQTSTYVPIGTIYQAQLPPTISANAYRIKSEKTMARLKILKIHQPQTHEQFYYAYHGLIESLFGKDRTYEDVVTIFNCFRQYSCSFEEYVKNEGMVKFWEKYFRDKEKAMQQKTKKKKKKKGTIPV